jgi:hypothetical protein
MAGAQLSEELALVASIPPAVGAIGAVSSDVIDMKLLRRALFALTVGEYGAADATINVVVYANTTNSTSGGTAISGKTFTAATFSGSAAGTNSEGLIEVSASEVAAAVAGGRYAYATVTIAEDTVAYSLAVLAGVARYEDASEYDLASVKAIIR